MRDAINYEVYKCACTAMSKGSCSRDVFMKLLLSRSKHMVRSYSHHFVLDDGISFSAEHNDMANCPFIKYSHTFSKDHISYDIVSQFGDHHISSRNKCEIIEYSENDSVVCDDSDITKVLGKQSLVSLDEQDDICDLILKVYMANGTMMSNTGHYMKFSLDGQRKMFDQMKLILTNLYPAMKFFVTMCEAVYLNAAHTCLLGDIEDGIELIMAVNDRYVTLTATPDETNSDRINVDWRYSHSLIRL